MRPFLKWAGNKYQIIKQLQALLPQGERLIEPFAGSGAVFLNTDYPRNLLNDTNVDLINLYKLLKSRPNAFIEHCRQFFDTSKNTKKAFYAIRDEFNNTDDPWMRATLFVYLNRHAFNGLCRYNASGGFNVPFGTFDKPYFPEREMCYFAKKAGQARFSHSDFRQVMRKAQPGDVVYCDPPYVPLSDTACFTSYSGQVFAELQQRQLATQAEKLAAKGIPVIISNHDTPLTRQLYKNAELISLSVKRSISSKGSTRKPVQEVIAVFN